MNIFVLDESPKKAAKYHCDKHVVKMILETAQMLCTADYLATGNEETIYKPTHKGHPCTKWAAESRENFKWLLELGNELLEEYNRRYGKNHKSGKVMRHYNDNLPDIESKGITDRPMAMPDECKKNTVVESYRNYYIQEKLDFAAWDKLDNTPSWLTNNEEALKKLFDRELAK